jgi:hypothetical protein
MNNEQKQYFQELFQNMIANPNRQTVGHLVNKLTKFEKQMK